MSPEPFLFPFQAMGTACSFHIFAADEMGARRAAQAGAREVYRLEGKYSRYDAESYLSAINAVAAAGGVIAVDRETADLIDLASDWHRDSGGLFDITSGVLRRAWNFETARMPSQEEIDALLRVCGLQRLVWNRPELAFPVAGMEIDLGGIVKEYAADRAASVMIEEGGAASVLVELGGDIAVAGVRPDRKSWRVGIRRPSIVDGPPLTIVELVEGGLATSGDYERFFEIDGKRYSHILNPLTGMPIEGAASVSVMAGSCLEAGRRSTLAMLKGEAGPDWLAACGLRYLAIKKEGAASGPLLQGAGTIGGQQAGANNVSLNPGAARPSGFSLSRRNPIC